MNSELIYKAFILPNQLNFIVLVKFLAAFLSGKKKGLQSLTIPFSLAVLKQILDLKLINIIGES